MIDLTNPVAFGLDLEVLAAACSTGDAAAAERHLRWGSVDPDVRRAGAAVGPEWFRRQWFEVRRLLTPTEGASLAFEPVFSALAGLGSECALLFGAGSDGEAHAWIGVPASHQIGAWLRRLVAPTTLLKEETERPSVAAVIAHAAQDPLRLTRGVRFRLVPAHQPVGGEDLSVLHRLFAVPNAGWALALTLQPVQPWRIDQLMSSLGRAASSAARFVTSTSQVDETRSASIEDPAMRRVLDWIELLSLQLTEGRSSGLWSVAATAFGIEPVDLAVAMAATSTALRTTDDFRARWVCDDLITDQGHLVTTTLCTTFDVANLLRAPNASIGALVVSDSLPTSRTPLTSSEPIDLGSYLGVDDEVEIGLEDLDGHAFVVGTTGAGKSNSVARLITQIWNRHDVPFLVIDPVKSEYEGYATLVKGGLVVVSGSELRMNVLQPWPGFDPAAHLGLVASAVRGCFSLPSPVPYVLRLLFDALSSRARHDPPPTLHDLTAMLAPLVADLGYSGELESNIRASLGTRLSVLTDPQRAEQFCAVDSSMIQELMSTPSVVQLGDLADEEERAFVMTMLALYATESARVRGAYDGVAHVTVVEEAHRVIPATSAGGSHAASSDGVVGGSGAGDLFGQLLTEVRSFGESLLIVDQSPAAVAREVLRNTNLKIAHRLVDPDDRVVVGGSLGLADDESAGLAQLGVGEVLIGSRRLSRPAVVAVDRVTAAGGSDRVRRPAAAPARTCCATPVDHHRAERLAAEAEDIVGGSLAAAFTGTPVDVATALRRLAARHAGTSVSCLYLVGLREHLAVAVRLGAIDPLEVGHLLAAAEPTHAHLGKVASAVAPGLSALDRPYSSCRSCPSPCSARAWAASGLVSREVALRREVTLRGSFVDAVGPWAAGLREELEYRVGGAAAEVAVLCVASQAAVRSGFGDFVDRRWLSPAGVG